MKKLFSLSWFLLFVNQSMAQRTNISIGEEFRLTRYHSNQMQVYADSSGIFLADRYHPQVGYFVYAPIKNESASLIRFDSSLKEDYRREFRKELNGKQFEDFFFLKHRLFLMASAYNYKTLSVSLFSIEIDKATGSVIDEWKQLTSWRKYNGYEDFEVKGTYNYDSSGVVVVASLGDRKRNVYDIYVFDHEMKKLANPRVENDFDPKTYLLEQVFYTSAGNILLAGRLGSLDETKKNNKRLQFQKYSIAMYNNEGRRIRTMEFNDPLSRFFSVKIGQAPNKDILLAAFYSQDKKDETIGGIVVQYLDPSTGQLKNMSDEKFDPAMISKDGEIEENPKEGINKTIARSKERDKRAEENGFLKYARFNDFVITGDGGILVFAEKYMRYNYSITKMGGGFAGGVGGFGTGANMNSNDYDFFEIGDIIVTKINPGGQIAWVTAIPKKQMGHFDGTDREFNNRLNFNIGRSYFGNDPNTALFAGFGYSLIPGESTISVFFNDHTDNGTSWENGKALQSVAYFSRSDCYAMHIDILSGKSTAEKVFSNKGQSIAMPGSGYPSGNDFYYLLRTDQQLGKSLLRLGKITFK